MRSRPSSLLLSSFLLHHYSPWWYSSSLTHIITYIWYAFQWYWSHLPTTAIISVHACIPFSLMDPHLCSFIILPTLLHSNLWWYPSSHTHSTWYFFLLSLVPPTHSSNNFCTRLHTIQLDGFSSLSFCYPSYSLAFWSLMVSFLSHTYYKVISFTVIGLTYPQ